jgi:hypothetical protein
MLVTKRNSSRSRALAKTLRLLQATRGIKREPVMLEPQSLEP